MSRTLSIVVLAGGKSTRMGRDKAMVELEPDQRPMLEIVLGQVTSLSDDIFVVANRTDEYARFGARIVPDRYPGAAALGGIGTAIGHARYSSCLVISCDQPFVSPDLIRAMAVFPGAWDVLVPLTQGESRQGGSVIRQTLHSIYGKACLPAIERAIAAGRLQTVSFFDAVNVETLDESFLRRFDTELRSLFSVNTPEALAIANGWRTEMFARDCGS